MGNPPVGVTISRFSLIDGRLTAAVSIDENRYINLSNLGITEVNLLSLEEISSISLSNNNIEVLSSTFILPTNLTDLDLTYNSISNWELSEAWANAQPIFEEALDIYAHNNLAFSVSTETYSILYSKNIYIQDVM